MLCRVLDTRVSFLDLDRAPARGAGRGLPGGEAIPGLATISALNPITCDRSWSAHWQGHHSWPARQRQHLPSPPPEPWTLAQTSRSAPAGGAGLDLAGGEADGEVGDEGVLRLPGPVAGHDAPPGVLRVPHLRSQVIRFTTMHNDPHLRLQLLDNGGSWVMSLLAKLETCRPKPQRSSIMFTATQ